MYDYEYENDVLLFLRLLKFLHTEYPFVLEQIIKITRQRMRKIFG